MLACTDLIMALRVDKDLLNDRIKTRESVSSAPASIGKMGQRLNMFIAALVKEDKKAAAEQYHFLMKDVKLMGLEMRKLEAIFNQLPIEQKELEETGKALDARMKQTEADIVRLKKELEVEQEVYRQKLEYEALARTVVEFPSKAQSRAEIAKTQAELSALEQQEKQLRNTVELRRRQLYNALNACTDLKASLEYDKKSEEEKQNYVAMAAVEVGGTETTEVVAAEEDDDEMQMD